MTATCCTRTDLAGRTFGKDRIARVDPAIGLWTVAVTIGTRGRSTIPAIMTIATIAPGTQRNAVVGDAAARQRPCCSIERECRQLSRPQNRLYTCVLGRDAALRLAAQGVTPVKTTSLAAFAVFLAFTPAHAQPTQSDNPIEAQDVTPIARIDEVTLAGSARARKLIGSKVYKGDASIGQIEDVLVDLDHATVTAVIFSVGGFLGLGDKLVAVPVGQIKVGSEAKFTTGLTKDELVSAPTFDFSTLK